MSSLRRGISIPGISCVFLIQGLTHAKEIVIPHLTDDRSAWVSRILVDNHNQVPAVFNLTLFDDGIQVYEGNHQVDGYSNTIMDVANLAQTATCGLIQSEEPLLLFRLSFESLEGGGLTEFVLTPDRGSTSTFEFSDFSPNISWKGLAIANLSAITAHVKLFAIGNGRILGESEDSIPALSRIRGLYSDWFPDIAFADLDSIVAVSNYVLLAGLAISGDPTNTHLLFTSSTVLPTFPGGTCGNGICEANETQSSCSLDCNPVNCFEGFDDLEATCLAKGWERIGVDVEGQDRDLLWRSSASSANRRGSILLLHGGGGSASNFCDYLPLNQPLEAFCDLAVAAGFSIFAVNSSFNRATDENGLALGKRWDCMQQPRKNIDLVFLDRVISEVVPAINRGDQAENVFIAGISNGGYMTILAATHFSHKLSGFAVISAGDPYGTYIDVSASSERTCAPGVFVDRATQFNISARGACESATLLNEWDWPTSTAPIRFKQFHHRGDALCDYSCMVKARSQLVAHGFVDDGTFSLSGPRTVLNHFWQTAYNQPLLAFFTEIADQVNNH